MKPYLKYVGGKSHLAPLIKSIWESHGCPRLVEPFAGSLAVALALDPNQALLNDANEHVINLHQHVKNWLVFEQGFKNEEAFYYQARSQFNQLIREGRQHSQEAAELYFYLNRNCFNGLSRFNQKGEFNVPFGKYKKVNYQKEFASYSIAMLEWDIKCGDFEVLEINDSDFMYVDPPYDSSFTQYSKEGFYWDDQLRLMDWMDNHSGPLIVSNLATDRILTLYFANGYDVYTYAAPRRISCKGDRKPALEMMAFKNVDLTSVLNLSNMKPVLSKYTVAKAA